MSTALVKFYDPKKKRVVLLSTRLIAILKPKIVQIFVGKTNTTVKMAPEWFKHNDQNQSLENIVYPQGIEKKDERTFNTVARYRSAKCNPSNNFEETPLQASVESTETLIIALDDFVHRFGGELSFSEEELNFEETAHRAACGVANLSSAHLLATDYIPTAKFSFLIDLDYQTDLARSTETMQNFVLQFTNSIANVLSCSKDYVRVISVEKVQRTRRLTKVNFGVTTPSPEKTEELVEDLKSHAKKGFPNDRILKHVQADDYSCEYLPLINYFQLKLDDFDCQYNLQYTSDMPSVDKRGGLSYYLPIGWHRHALKVIDKYPDDQLWLESKNIDGEWPVAFHGTHEGAVKGIREQGLRITKVDVMRDQAIELKGKDFDKPGLYVATHCNGGAHPTYTTPFNLKVSAENIQTYRVVFQCRVKPGEYTEHRDPVREGYAWRFVDPDHIRPYGILLKNEHTEQ